MSTFGTAVVIDVPDEASRRAAAALLQSRQAASSWDRPDCQVYVTTAPDGMHRLTAGVHPPGLLDELMAAVPTLGSGRVAVAEDFDEYGAQWAVLAIENGSVRTVHRRYVLNADPADPSAVAAAIAEEGADPRSEDLAGEGAAADSATLFGVDPTAMIAAERGSDSAFEGIGVVGGPFPWWDALILPWPQPGAGVLLEEVTVDPDRPAVVDPLRTSAPAEQATPRRRWWQRNGR